MDVSPSIKDRIRKEIYSNKWREAVRSLDAHIDENLIGDETALKLQTFMKQHREIIHRLVDRAESLNPTCYPMKAVRFEIIFSLEARTIGFENKRVIFSNMALLFLRAFRGKEFESCPFIGSKLGFKSKNPGTIARIRAVPFGHSRGQCVDR